MTELGRLLALAEDLTERDLVLAIDEMIELAGRKFNHSVSEGRYQKWQTTQTGSKSGLRTY